MIPFHFFRNDDNLPLVERILYDPNLYPYIGAGLGYLAGAAGDIYMSRRSDLPPYTSFIPTRLLGAGAGALAGYGVQKTFEKKSAYAAMIDIAEILIRGGR